MAQRRDSVMHNIAALVSTHVAGRVIRFLYMLVVARLLGPEETGIYLYGVALYLGVIALSQFGQEVFLAQRVGKHAGMPKTVLQHSLSLTLAATVLVCAVLAILAGLSEPDPRIRVAVWCFVGALASRTVAFWVRAAYVALERPGWVPRYEAGFRGLEAVAGSATLLAGGDLVVVCALHFLMWSVEAWMALRKLAREHPGILGLGGRWRYLRGVIAVSAVYVVSAAAMAVFSQLAVVLLRKLQPDGALVGHFGIAMQFMTTLMIAPVAVAQAFMPRLGRSYSRGDGGHDLITATKLVGLLALAGAVVAAAYGPWFVVLALGQAYAPAAELFRWLCWGLPPFAIAVVLGQCLNVVGGRRIAAAIFIFMTVAHVVLLVAYIDHDAATAAVGSLVAAASGGALIAFIQVGPRLGLAQNAWWVKLVLVIGVTFAVFEGGWAPLPLAAPVALAVACALTWMLQVLNTEDLAKVRRAVARRTPVP